MPLFPACRNWAHHGLGRAQEASWCRSTRCRPWDWVSLERPAPWLWDAVYLPDERGSHGVQLVLVAAAIVSSRIFVGRPQSLPPVTLILFSWPFRLIWGDVLRPAGRLNPVKAVLGHNVELVACIEILVGRVKDISSSFDLVGEPSLPASSPHSNVEGVAAVGVLER